MTADRDEFAAATKHVLALRAAAEGGPRFDRDQTTEERRAPANGIWVCHDCSDLIDKDRAAFPAEMLLTMKLQHEQWVSQEDLVPELPAVSVQTYAGLALSAEGSVSATGEMIEKHRDHMMEIAASSRHELIQLKMRVQFPESVIAVNVLERPIGLGVSIRRETSQWVANASGGGSVTAQGPMTPSNCFVVEQERVVAARPLKFMLRTIWSERLGLLGQLWGDDDAWSTYAEGTFLYADQGKFSSAPSCSDCSRTRTALFGPYRPNSSTDRNSGR
jgi:hypothetical protein